MSLSREELDRMQRGAQRKREAGIKSSYDPYEQAKRNPTSRAYAIKAFCYECLGCDPGWRKECRECSATNCPLYKWRPYKEENHGTEDK